MELVIVKPGTRLSISNGRLRIRDPERESDQYVALGDLTQITLDKRCYLSAAVLYTALERGIEVVLSGRSGAPVGRLWSQRFGSITTIRRRQLEWSAHKDACHWVEDTLSDKINGQRALLFSLRERSNLTQSIFDQADSNMQKALNRLQKADKNAPPSENADLWRSIEGAASRVYFQTLSAVLPGEWSFKERSQHPAKDAFNALLNYGYGILYNRVEGALLSAGLDPAIGVFHVDGYRRPSLVYDFIEPFRIWIDFVVTGLVFAKALTADDFDIELEDEEMKNGIRLSEGARHVIVQAVIDYYNEIIELDGQSRTRLTHLQAQAHSLAQYLLKWNP